MEKTIKRKKISQKRRNFLLKKILNIFLLSLIVVALSYFFKVIILNRIHINSFEKNYYGEYTIKKYKTSKTYPYISKFLLPYFLPELENIKNQQILDAGCGTGLWALYAANNGAKVYGIDIQPGMIKQAKISAIEAGLQDQIDFEEGDVAKMKFNNDRFDKALSINVACNLDVKSFDKHFSELRRVLKKNAVAIVTAPISHEIIFTNGSKKNKKELLEDINHKLNSLGKNPDPLEIEKTLNSLNGVLSATFKIENKRLTLVTDINQLKEGQKIWRKLPNISIPNRYYSERYFEKAINKANLIIDKKLNPKFKSESERLEYNFTISSQHQMGLEYVYHSPFVIYYLRK